MMQLTACAVSVPVKSVPDAAPDSDSETEDNAQTANTTEEGTVYSNDYFEITIPSDLADIARIDVESDTIGVYDKASYEAGFGGFDFSIWAAGAAMDFAGGPYIKIGELSNDEGKILDVIKGSPTEVQWDYNAPDMPADFKKIDDASGKIIDSIKGINGYTYTEGAGMKGEDLYGEIVDKYVKAVNEGWDAAKYEEEGMSPEIFGCAVNAPGNPLDAIGVAYQDVNVDGIDEMFVVPLEAEKDFKGVAYDIYTMVDHKPANVVSGTSRNRYFDYENAFISREWSGGAGCYGVDVYALMTNSTEMIYQYGYKIDAYENEEKPWFISYDGKIYDNVTEEEYNERANDEKGKVNLEYKPLSEVSSMSTDEKGGKNHEASKLPPYDYPGPELFFTVLYQYMIDEFGSNYDKADVGIPCPIIIAMDENDRDDIKVWGDFWYFNYDLNGDILENTSGGSYPGLIHVKTTDEGYEVTGFDAVGDGSDFDPTAKKIFGKYYDEFVKSSADTEGREKTRAQIIANYVAANNLNITAYQDYGWDPVTLPKENIDNFYSTLD